MLPVQVVAVLVSAEATSRAGAAVAAVAFSVVTIAGAMIVAVDSVAAEETTTVAVVAAGKMAVETDGKNRQKEIGKRAF